MAKKTEEKDGKIYDVSILSYQDNHIKWNNANVSQLTMTSDSVEVGIYSAELYTIDDIEGILDRFGFVDLVPDISGNGDIYMWDLGDLGAASYTPDTGDFMLESEGLGLPAINLGYVSKGNASTYFESFVSEYLKVEADFNIEIKDLDDGVKVTGTWKVDGYDVVSSVNQESMIGAVFSENGDLESLFVSLVKFRAKEEDVSLVTVDELKSYLQWGSYPKVEYVNISSLSELECEDYDCYVNYDIGDVSGVKFESTELVYYFNLLQPDNVFPAYKVIGEGEVDDEEGQTIQVEVVVYTNAIDPTRIRVRPSQ